VRLPNKQIPNIIRFTVVGFLLHCFVMNPVFAAPPKHYPEPPETPERLFYVQHSGNPNTVIYDVRQNNKGKILNKPVSIYWIRYNTNKERRDLNFLERTMAYGIEYEKLDNSQGYEINLISYPNQSIHVFLDSQGKAFAQTKIKGELANLKRIYLTVDESGFLPKVKSFEIFGYSVKTNQALIESVRPNDNSDSFDD